MPVHQCPKCVLRFDLAPMLADHLATDHDATPAQLLALQPPAVAVGQRPIRGRREPSAAGGAELRQQLPVVPPAEDGGQG